MHVCLHVYVYKYVHKICVLCKNFIYQNDNLDRAMQTIAEVVCVCVYIYIERGVGLDLDIHISRYVRVPVYV